MTEKDFQKLLLDAVDDAFSSLGDSARQSIYYHLESKFKIARDEIPCRLEDFEDGLERIFGAGTKFLEILIMRNLHDRVGPEEGAVKWNEGKEFKFVEYVKVAARSYSKKKKTN